ncbi:hypothetical protein HY086_05995 [Candidatus Gottesmanbacteria bacterium]|nr:hypothetical protein [Candidatus Gottesmanbacteria bacterium]
MISLVFFVINLFFLLFLFFLVMPFVTGAPFVPSTKKTAESMIRLAKLKKGIKIYDLGSGEGRLLKLAAEKGATAIGFEINPFLVLLSRLRGLVVYWKNFWHADFADADVVFVYLLPWKMEKLEAFLKKQLKPGSLIVSNSFIFPHWKILRQDRANHVYVFRV